MKTITHQRISAKILVTQNESNANLAAEKYNIEITLLQEINSNKQAL